MTIQLGYSYYWCLRSGLAPGRVQPRLVGPLAGYGLTQLAAVTPTAINNYLDQLVLSQLVPPADLGRYAIAVSVTMIPVPLVSAIGNVGFPRLAAQRSGHGGRQPDAAGRRGRQRGRGGRHAAAHRRERLLADPAVFGPAYRGAVPLLWILTPGGIFLACGQVVGDLLRGLNRPGLVAAAQGLAAVFTVILLLALLPSAGVAAAAIASTVAYGTALALMIRWLRRPPGARRARHRRARTPDLRSAVKRASGKELMRIGIVGPTRPDSFAANIIEALPAMGHEPVALGSSYAFGNPYTSGAVGIMRNALPALDERGQRRIARAALDAGCELVIASNSADAGYRAPAPAQRDQGRDVVPRLADQHGAAAHADRAPTTRSSSRTRTW